MSQIYKSTASGPAPPGVVETLTGDTGTNPVSPDGAHNINVFGDPDAPGIVTRGDSAANTVYFGLQIPVECGTGTTVNTGTADLITLDLGATPASYTFIVIITGKAATASSGGGQIVASLRTDGAAATLEETPDIIYNSSLVLSGASYTILASGNNAIVRATGSLGTVIAWKACAQYILNENGV
jgi:hypothetical protein